jgi:hypothetical protein
VSDWVTIETVVPQEQTTLVGIMLKSKKMGRRIGERLKGFNCKFYLGQYGLLDFQRCQTYLRFLFFLAQVAHPER